MMISKKEEEKNEKIIRGLLKLPPNRKCMNCNSLGPQYACTNFWTFVCVTCSGIHREFTHRVKSVSMAKFTKQEVNSLQDGGNQRAKEMFLKGWDTQRLRFPDSSNPDKIREFIKCVYIEKRYAVGKCFDKPEKDQQGLQVDDDIRRASSYHSFSQSPPYDHHYEDRLYGKKSGMLTRKPGSERVNYESRVPSLVYSPGSVREQMYEDRFSNDGGSRISDYSVSNTSDRFRRNTGAQSLQDSAGYKVGIPLSRMSSSSGSFGSFDSNSVSLKSVKSGSLVDIVSDPSSSSIVHHNETSISSSPRKPTVNQDISREPVQRPVTLIQDIGLFADINVQTSNAAINAQGPGAFPLQENVGWATFDLPHYCSEIKKDIPIPAPVSFGDVELRSDVNVLSSLHGASKQSSEHNLLSHGLFSSIGEQLPAGLDVKAASDTKLFQPWNAFDKSEGSISDSLVNSLPRHTEQFLQDSYPGLKSSQESVPDEFHHFAGDDATPALSLPFYDLYGSSFPAPAPTDTGGTTQKATNPFDLPYDLETETEDNGLFLGMSSLQEALTSPELPSTFLGTFAPPFFSPNPVNAYVGGQASSPQLPNIPSQGPAMPVTGNPFD